MNINLVEFVFSQTWVPMPLVVVRPVGFAANAGPTATASPASPEALASSGSPVADVN